MGVGSGSTCSLRCRRKTFTFAISSSDELFLLLVICFFVSVPSVHFVIVINFDRLSWPLRGAYLNI